MTAFEITLPQNGPLAEAAFAEGLRGNQVRLPGTSIHLDLDQTLAEAGLAAEPVPGMRLSGAALEIRSDGHWLPPMRGSLSELGKAFLEHCADAANRELGRPLIQHRTVPARAAARPAVMPPRQPLLDRADAGSHQARRAWRRAHSAWINALRRSPPQVQPEPPDWFGQLALACADLALIGPIALAANLGHTGDVAVTLTGQSSGWRIGHRLHLDPARAGLDLVEVADQTPDHFRRAAIASLLFAVADRAFEATAAPRVEVAFREGPGGTPVGNLSLQRADREFLLLELGLAWPAQEADGAGRLKIAG